MTTLSVYTCHFKVTISLCLTSLCIISLHSTTRNTQILHPGILQSLPSLTNLILINGFIEFSKCSKQNVANLQKVEDRSRKWSIQKVVFGNVICNWRKRVGRKCVWIWMIDWVCEMHKFGVSNDLVLHRERKREI